MSNYYDDFKVDVPVGISNHWEVKQFTVDAKAAARENMFATIKGHGRGVPEGTYTGLYRSGSVIMSDTPDEINDHSRFIRKATGRVLIAGLGIGMVLQNVAKKDTVEHVTVIEKSPDVLKLVAEHYMAKPFASKLTIIEADIFTWTPAKGSAKYDWAWMDVWDNLCTDNLDEMATLNRRFARRATNKHAWGQELLKRQRAHDKRNPWY